MINSVLIVFAFKTYIPCYLVIINICRDIIIDGYKMFAASKNVIVAANFFGKLKTILQMIGIIVIFFFFNNKINHKEKVFYYLIQNLLIFEATIATIIAGVVYIIQINKAIAYDPTKNS